MCSDYACAREHTGTHRNTAYYYHLEEKRGTMD